jgi:hypothetical protein
LRHVLPAGNAERTGEYREVVFVSIQRRTLEAHVEAHGAAGASLGLPLHTLGPREPVILVVIRIHKFNTVLVGEADVLFLAQQVFVLGVDVRIVEKDGVFDA